MLSLHMLPGTDKNNLVRFLLGHICVTSILWKMICFSSDKTATFLRFGAVLFYVKKDKIEPCFLNSMENHFSLVELELWKPKSAKH